MAVLKSNHGDDQQNLMIVSKRLVKRAAGRLLKGQEEIAGSGRRLVRRQAEGMTEYSGRRIFPQMDSDSGGEGMMGGNEGMSSLLFGSRGEESEGGESASSAVGSYVIPVVFCSMFVAIGIASLVITAIIVRKKRKEREQGPKAAPKIAVIDESDDLPAAEGGPQGGGTTGFKGMLSRSWSRVVHSKSNKFGGGGKDDANEGPFLSGIEEEKDEDYGADGEEYDVEDGEQHQSTDQEHERNDLIKMNEGYDNKGAISDEANEKEALGESRRGGQEDEEEEMDGGDAHVVQHDHSYAYLGNFDYESTKEDYQHPFDIIPTNAAKTYKSNVHPTSAMDLKTIEANPAAVGSDRNKDNKNGSSKVDQWKYQLMFDLERGDKGIRMIDLSDLDQDIRNVGKQREQQQAAAPAPAPRPLPPGRSRTVVNNFETTNNKENSNIINHETTEGGEWVNCGVTAANRTPSLNMETIGDWVEPVAESRDLIVMQDHPAAHLRPHLAAARLGGIMNPLPYADEPRPGDKKIPMNALY